MLPCLALSVLFLQRAAPVVVAPPDWQKQLEDAWRKIPEIYDNVHIVVESKGDDDGDRARETKHCVGCWLENEKLQGELAGLKDWLSIMVDGTENAPTPVDITSEAIKTKILNRCGGLQKENKRLEDELVGLKKKIRVAFNDSTSNSRPDDSSLRIQQLEEENDELSRQLRPKNDKNYELSLRIQQLEEENTELKAKLEKDRILLQEAQNRFADRFEKQFGIISDKEGSQPDERLRQLEEENAELSRKLGQKDGCMSPQQYEEQQTRLGKNHELESCQTTLNDYQDLFWSASKEASACMAKYNDDTRNLKQRIAAFEKGFHVIKQAMEGDQNEYAHLFEIERVRAETWENRHVQCVDATNAFQNKLWDHVGELSDLSAEIRLVSQEMSEGGDAMWKLYNEEGQKCAECWDFAASLWGGARRGEEVEQAVIKILQYISSKGEAMVEEGNAWYEDVTSEDRELVWGMDWE